MQLDKLFIKQNSFLRLSRFADTCTIGRLYIGRWLQCRKWQYLMYESLVVFCRLSNNWTEEGITLQTTRACSIGHISPDSKICYSNRAALFDFQEQYAMMSPWEKDNRVILLPENKSTLQINPHHCHCSYPLLTSFPDVYQVSVYRSQLKQMWTSLRIFLIVPQVTAIILLWKGWMNVIGNNSFL